MNYFFRRMNTFLLGQILFWLMVISYKLYCLYIL